MKIQFSTRDYRIGHGKEPRGQGYWAFLVSIAVPSNELPPEPELMWASGTLGEAKKKLAEQIALKFPTAIYIEAEVQS